jgi:hypothetical protein
MTYQFADAGGMSMHHFLHTHRSDRGSGSVQLQAALSATPAGKPIHFHHMMTEFSGRPTNTEMELPVHHHPTADARADRQADDRIRASTCPKGPFAKGSQSTPPASTNSRTS